MRRGLNDFAFEEISFMGDNGELETVRLRDYSIKNIDAKVSIRFFHVIDAIAERITQSEYVVGCSPWLTSTKIREALQEIKAFSIVASSPDTKSRFGSDAKFPHEIVKKLEWEDVDFAFEDWSKVQPVEFVKMIEQPQRSERLHSKFIVFYDRLNDGSLVAREFVMGSANLSNNAENQFECVTFIESEQATRAMIYNWYQMLIVAGYQRDKALIRLGAFMSELDQHNRDKAPWAWWGLETEDPWAMQHPDFFLKGS